MRTAKKVAKGFGAEILVARGRVVVDASAWTPTGKVWNSTGCHCIHEAGEKDDSEPVWSALIAGMQEGVSDCDGEDCDTCDLE